MADLKTSIIIRAVDKLTAPVKKITAANGRLRESFGAVARPVRVLTERQRDLGRSVERTTRRLRPSVEVLGRWGRAARGAAAMSGRLLWQAGKLSAALGGFGYSLKRAFIDPAAEFERFETILTTIEGSSEKARESMKWIDDFAVKTPYQMDQVADAFVKLRSYGLDPTKGLMRDLGDAAAAMGKPIMQAVEAIADAVTGENERLKEFGIKARAVEGGKFRYEYTVDGETRFAEALADDRAGIERTLREIFAARGFTGAMEEQSKIWEGMFSNLMDQLTRFSRLVMEAGAFDHLKNRLRALLDTINQMADDGSLQELAERVGKGLVDAFESAEQTIRNLWPYALKIADAFSWAAEKLGGWGNLALTLSGLYLAKPFIGLVGSLKGVVSWSGEALGALRKMTGASAKATAAPAGARALGGVTGGLFRTAPAATGVAAPGTGLLAGLMGRLAAAGGIIKGVMAGITASVGLATAPFLAIAAAVVATALLVYKYWEPIKAFLSGVWSGLIEGLKPVFSALMPAFQSLIQWFGELFTPVEMTAGELIGFAEAGKAVGKAIGGLLVNLGKFVVGLVKLPFEVLSAAAQIGSALVTAIGDGITAAAEAMLGPLKWVLDKARALLPSSDARIGPLSRLTAAGASILETMGLGVLRAGPDALQRPLARAFGTAAAGLALTLPAAAAAPLASPGGVINNDNSIHMELTIHQQPGEDAGALAERVLREIEQRRRVSSRGALYDEL